MKQFRFSLAAVLKLAKRRDQAAQAALARWSAELAALRARERMLKAATLQASRDASLAGPTSALSAAYFASLTAQRVESANGISRAGAERRRARTDWMAARQRRRSLERLEDARREEYRSEMFRQEQRELEQLSAWSEGGR